MAKLCPLHGCKATTGRCIHDTLMIVMALMVAGLGLAHWGLHVV